MALRTFESGQQKFTIRISEIPSGDGTAWEVVSVTQVGENVRIPGLENVVSADEDTAYARACDRIEKYLAART